MGTLRPMKRTHSFIMHCFYCVDIISFQWIYMSRLCIFLKMLHCHSYAGVSEVILKDLGKIDRYQTALNMQKHEFYNDVIMSAMASLAFVRGIHWRPMGSPHKGPVTRKCFDLMTPSWTVRMCHAMYHIFGFYLKQIESVEFILVLPMCMRAA